MSASSVEVSVLYLLDTSAILAYCLNEPEGGRVALLVKHASIPFIAFAELYAALWLRFGQAKADEAVATIRQWHRPIVWPSEEMLLFSGRLRARYRLGLADSLIAALAYRDQVTLVTKDPDFKALVPDVKLLFLE